MAIHVGGRMDRERILEVAPHYVVMIVLVYVVLVVIEVAVGGLQFWVEFAVVVVVVSAYRPVVVRLGLAPGAWE